MSEHLPECADPGVMPHAIDCFCAVIRACEQRVISEAVQRIKALPWAHENWMAFDERVSIIAALEGEQT